jgi:cytochrome bd ubiquinol oxidase subunit I
LASWLSNPSDGTSTVVQGLDTVPADQRPTDSQVNTVHLAWDLMVGRGTLLFLLSAWYWLCWIFRRDMPKSKLFLRIASCAGVAAIVCMEAGWVRAYAPRSWPPRWDSGWQPSPACGT